jgi:hypothetical protein
MIAIKRVDAFTFESTIKKAGGKLDNHCEGHRQKRPADEFGDRLGAAISRARKLL